MLNLASKREKTYVLRENMYGSGYYVVDIDSFAHRLRQRMKTPSAIVDFVFMCFMVGNDFLPQIPTLEIFNGGIEALLGIYTETCQPFGIINTSNNQIRVNTLIKFLGKLANQEKDIMLDKYRKLDRYFPDPLISKHFFWNKELEKEDCNFEEYKKAYYSKKLPDVNINELCQEYVRGMQWVIHYYTQGIPSWSWQFPYLYGPFIHDICQMTDYEFKPYSITKPYKPFQQLLAVLPPSSSKLIPSPLDNLLTSENSPIREYYPSDFEVDISGKRAEWEGIVVLPTIDMKRITDLHDQVEKMIDERSQRLNKLARPQLFYYMPNNVREFKSFLGDIPECHVFWKFI
jgi:5'-3' exoribonuclease 2